MSLSTLFNYSIFELIPNSKKEDPQTKIFFIVVKEIIRKHIVENNQYLIFLDNIDNMREDLVDLIAEELHVDYYDYKSPLEQKRIVVKNSFLIHMKKGTKYAVELVMNIFFTNAKLLEWFEYNGIPGTFKIKLDMQEGYVFPDLKKLSENVDTTKRKSQKFEGIETVGSYEGSILVGNTTGISTKIKFFNENNFNVGLGSYLTSRLKAHEGGV